MAPGEKKIRSRDRDTIIRALGAGVVPRLGLQHLQVGRTQEVQALIKDIERVADSSSSFRFVIGEYGAGKTFFLNLVRVIALEKKLITAHADLSPNHRLHATNGSARALFAETMKNLSTRSKPEGGALESIIEVFIGKANDEAKKANKEVVAIIAEKLASLREQSGGFDFANVIAAYLKANETGSEELKTNAIRWLRAEFTTKTEAKAALGVRTIIDDAGIYDHWKLIAQFCKLAGYGGLLIILDEMVNVYKLQNSKSRESNYEQLLRMLNDSLQGQATPLGFALGGTGDFLRDSRRGVFSYKALQSRLAENSFVKAGLVDFSGPVINLQNLTREDLYVLLENIRKVFASGDPKVNLVPDEALRLFIDKCEQTLGETYFRTPRTTVKQFVQFLSVLEQNKKADWRNVLGTVTPETEMEPQLPDIADDDNELITLKL